MMTDETADGGAAERGHLLRVLGVAFGIAVVVGGTIGQGILRTPGIVAENSGAPVLIIVLWALGAVVAWIDSMSTVELASSIRQAGGPFTFAQRAFGSLPGLAVGICDWLANLAVIAFIAVVFAEYLHRLGIATDVPLGAMAAVLVLLAGSIQLLGTKAGGRSQEIGSAVKAVLFLVLILALFFWPRSAPVASVVTPEAAAALTLGGVIVSLRAIFGTYQGWNSAAYFCEEVRDPGRDIARATFSGIAMVAAIYVLANLAYMSVLTPAEMAGSKLVAADAAARVFGPAAEPVVTAVSLISLVTVLNAMVMTFPRVLFGVSRAFNIPVFNRVAANGTPRAALFATVGLAALLASIGVYDLLLAFSVSLLAAMGMMANAAVIVMRVREPGLERPWKMPLYPLPAILALVINGVLWLAFVSEDPWTALQAFVALSALTLLAWLVMRRTQARAVKEST